jgi:hypothetical protein
MLAAAADAAAGGAEHLPAPASAEAAAGELLPTPAPSRARWWVLFLTCLMSAMQCAQWSWPGPIAGSLQALYGLDAAAIQLLLNWGPIMYLATSLPYAWAMRRSPAGLRGAIFTGIALTATSTLLRLACRGPGAGSQALTVSLILNAAAGPPAMTSVTMLCELWFSPSERATATAVAVESNVLDFTMAFIAGPILKKTSWAAKRNMLPFSRLMCVIHALGPR